MIGNPYFRKPPSTGDRTDTQTWKIMASSIVVIGSYVQDLTFNLPEFPLPGQTLIGEFTTGPGGKGSNQAVAVARTGVSTAFIGATGQDTFAQVARQFHE